ncbi:MAG: AMP-binding protein [Desulfobacteraceae bacterium]|jgi:acyl-coenzyme A synthetase/AMP-(fatty) acid ligase
MRTNPNMINYETTYASFKKDVPEYYNFSAQIIDKWAENPEKLAMLWVDDNGNEVRKTFSEISQSSQQAANALSNLGIKKGDKILLMISRQITWWEVMTACIRMGVVAIPVVTMLPAKDIQFRINQAKACCVIAEPQVTLLVDSLIDKCPSIKHRIVVDEPCEDWLFYNDIVSSAPKRFETAKTMSGDISLIYFTSSTEGATKMVMHTHASSAIAHKVTGKYWLDLGEDDLHWNISDTGWAKSAWSSYFGPWHMGAAIFIHHTATIDPLKILNNLATYPISTLCATPTIYRMMVLQNLTSYKFPHLRHCVGAGEPLTSEIIEIWKNDTGCTIQNGYGQTETGLLAASYPCLKEHLGALGKPVPGVELAIINENNEILPPETEGTIAVKIEPQKPMGFFAGYGKEEEEESLHYVNGWYLTGDRAYMDKDGYIWFVGRMDDVITSSGYRINPLEVEQTLMNHPAVFEAAVISSPNETYGQIAKAFVVLEGGYNPSEELVKELQEHVKSSLVPHKFPRAIKFVSELPKTFSGKLRRVDLRQAEWRSNENSH